MRWQYKIVSSGQEHSGVTHGSTKIYALESLEATYGQAIRVLDLSPVPGTNTTQFTVTRDQLSALPFKELAKNVLWSCELETEVFSVGNVLKIKSEDGFEYVLVGHHFNDCCVLDERNVVGYYSLLELV